MERILSRTNERGNAEAFEIDAPKNGRLESELIYLWRLGRERASLFLGVGEGFRSDSENYTGLVCHEEMLLVWSVSVG